MLLLARHGSQVSGDFGLTRRCDCLAGSVFDIWKSIPDALGRRFLTQGPRVVARQTELRRPAGYAVAAVRERAPNGLGANRVEVSGDRGGGCRGRPTKRARSRRRPADVASFSLQ